MIDIYAFSSANLTNIWAGVGAHLWAVSLEQARNASIRGKARNLPVGGVGIFYCVEDKALTTPFLIRSKPDLDTEITHVWPERWALSFRIVPLGSPEKRVPVSELRSKLPSLARTTSAWNSLFHISPLTVFAASKVSEDDWAVLIQELADE